MVSIPVSVMVTCSRLYHEIDPGYSFRYFGLVSSNSAIRPNLSSISTFKVRVALVLGANNPPKLQYNIPSLPAHTYLPTQEARQLFDVMVRYFRQRGTYFEDPVWTKIEEMNESVILNCLQVDDLH